MLLLFVLWSQFCLSTCDDVALVGGGTSAPAPMIKEWALSYHILKSHVDITFTPSDGDIGWVELTSPCRKNFGLDFVGSDLNFNLPQNSQGKVYPNIADFQVLPFIAGGVALAYNLGVPPSSTDQPLLLTREILLRIYRQEITKWNHPDIATLNTGKGFTLPNETILLALMDKPQGATVTLTLLLDAVDLDESPSGLKAGNSWNKTRLNKYGNNATVRWVQNSFHMVSTVLVTPFTLGYAPLYYVDQAGLPYATLRNRNGTDIRPTSAGLQAALAAGAPLDRIPLKSIINTNVADANGADVYPLSAIYYLVYHQNINDDCDGRRELWKFFNWVLTSEAAMAQILGSVGFGPFNENYRGQILENLRRVNCSGQSLLAYDYTEGSSALRQAAISISAILVSIVLLVLFTMGWKRNNATTRAAGLAFSTCFLLGCALNYLSVFVWALVPETDRICSARYILTALGYTLVLGSMFAKCWEIQKLFSEARSSQVSMIQELPWWKFCRVFFSVIGVNALLLLILGSIDPPRTYTQVTDPVDLIAHHACYVTKIPVWLGVEFTYFALLALWGAYLSWKTRDIWEKYNYPNESRSILLSIYNLIFCLTILLPLSTILSNNLEAEFFITAIAILFPTSFAFFSVWGPKVLSFIGSSFGGSRTKNSGARQASKQGPRVIEDGRSGRQETNHNVVIVDEADAVPKEFSLQSIDNHQTQGSPAGSPVLAPKTTIQA